MYVVSYLIWRRRGCMLLNIISTEFCPWKNRDLTSRKIIWEQSIQPAPRRKLEWCQSKTELIFALLKRSAGYLKEWTGEHLNRRWISKKLKLKLKLQFYKSKNDPQLDLWQILHNLRNLHGPIINTFHVKLQECVNL